jgi:hypothetical protein
MRTHRVCATAILPRVSAVDTDPVLDLLRGVPFFGIVDRVDLARLFGRSHRCRAHGRPARRDRRLRAGVEADGSPVGSG